MTTSSTEEPAKNPVNTVAPPPPDAKSGRWWLRKLLPAALFLSVGLFLIVLLGVAQRLGWIQSGLSTPAGTAQSGKQQIYTCPMHPQVRQPGPGKCFICDMALVPATTTVGDIDQLAINIEPAQRRLANIQTAEAKMESVSTSIETIGSIEIDESRQATIAAYINGRIEKLFADYTGVEVDKGDHLAIVYSPRTLFCSGGTVGSEECAQENDFRCPVRRARSAGETGGELATETRRIRYDRRSDQSSVVDR